MLPFAPVKVPVKIHVGIETFGDWSITVAAASDGSILAAERHPIRLNYYEMSTADLGAHIYALTKSLLTACGVSVSTFLSSGGVICAGIFGISNQFDRHVAGDEIWKHAGLANNNAISTGDIEIAFAGGCRSLRGAAITCHTGSVALARTESEIHRAGGWGPLFGDEGSEYWIGTAALRALARLRDGRLRQPTTLANYVHTELQSLPLWVDLARDNLKFDANWFNALIDFVRTADHQRCYRDIAARLSSAVFAAFAADPPDPSAVRIIEEAAAELADQLQAAFAAARLDPTDLPVVLWGGAFDASPTFEALLRRRIIQRWPSLAIKTARDADFLRPAVGALLFALSGSVFSLPRAEVTAAVAACVPRFPALQLSVPTVASSYLKTD
jgi:N-acetylglucosamine kinase-like BadF-type ATPase